MHLWNFFFLALDTITQPVLGKFPFEVKISMTISNSAGGFCYVSVSISPTVAICSIVVETIGISWLSQRDMPRNFARYATAGRFLQILL
jgi:hypothetical protein